MRVNGLPSVGKGFSDIGEHSFLLQPHIIIRAADIAQRRLITSGELYQPGMVRKVWYDDGTTKHYMELTFYVHPTGAADITLGTIAEAAGVRTYTPSVEGFFINEAGALIPNPEEVRDIAGQLFADYFYHFDDNINQKEHNRALVLEEGDACWLLRRGDTEASSTTAINADDMFMASTTVIGRVEASPAINTAGTIAQYETTVLQNTLGPVRSGARALGRATETIGAAGLFNCHLDLGPRFTVS